MKHIAYLSLGSNVGNREEYLLTAIKQLDSMESIEVTDYSSIYETDPVGYENQRNFLNMVIEVRTDLTAEQLLHTCLAVEKRLGRTRTIRFGPRTIDLDILLFNQENIKTEELIVPHPRMNERAFVLVPLAEINPRLILPDIGLKVQDQVKKTGDKGVRLWKQKHWGDVYGLFGN